VVTIAGSGDPLVEVEVCADDGIRDSCVSTDSNGAYDIAGWPPAVTGEVQRRRRVVVLGGLWPANITITNPGETPTRSS